MQYSCNLEMVNLRSSGPNQLYMQSRSYWVEIFKFIAAAGFDSVEMPYNPYSGDPVTLEIGRCGVPISRFAVESQYGGAAAFCKLLKELGIKGGVSGLHVSANDTMLELNGRMQDRGLLVSEFEKLALEALDFAVELGVRELVVSPSPERGYITPEMAPGFEDRLIAMLRRLCEKAEKKDVTVAFRNEYWGIFSGEGACRLMQGLTGCKNARYSPDLAHLYIAGANAVQLIQRYAGVLAAPRVNDSFFEDLQGNAAKPNAEIPDVGKQRIFCDIGDGNVDIAGAMGALRAAGYGGVVVCECRKTLNVYKALLKMKWYIDHKMA